MNSFSGVRRALEYEIPRQIEVARQGGKLVQETRRWDDVAGLTETMRTKEHAHDYRYFPEPDLMVFEPTEAWLNEVGQRVVELPLARKRRFMADYQLPAADAQAFVWDVPLGDYFEKLARHSKNPKAVANWVINNLRAKLTEANAKLAAEHGAQAVEQPKILGLADLKFEAEAILDLVELVEGGKISSSAAQTVFAEMFATGEPPSAIVERMGLAQLSDSAVIERFCDEAIRANPRSADDFRAGKSAALNFLKGQVMRLSKGKANPALVGEILERKLRR
jgi:aspartyl-tRNA(Asn)/glutamyl-tRNA(Gln) amidotransferase subunit B